jgi:hypothetical protein
VCVFGLISTLIICVIDVCFIAVPEQQKRQINSLPVKQKKKDCAIYLVDICCNSHREQLAVVQRINSNHHRRLHNDVTLILNGYRLLKLFHSCCRQHIAVTRSRLHANQTSNQFKTLQSHQTLIIITTTIMNISQM